MMCKNQSSRWAATKALLVVPMVAVALSAFATTEYVPREVQDKVTENSVNLQDEENPKPIVVVNGEKISYDEMSKIDPNTIHSMNVYKDYSKLPKELKISEDEAKNGVIVITLKKDGEGDANVAAAEKMIVIADKRESGPQTQTQSSTVSILGNTDATEMTTVKVSTKDGEKPTIIINGEEVPYASLSDIQSDTVESMDVYKLEDGTRVVYIALESNTTIDEALKPNDNLALVSGKVVDKDGEPIIGVIVQVEGTKRGAVTDVLGQFSIYASLDETLTFSYINMKTESVKVKSAKKPIVVTLKQE